ncbi:MAG TPA: alpha/beta hydrolase [Gammaproteobacteria bacterium]|nr:alpha/beta hydrolase [Gammaproteobacteria bacterium]
MGNLSKRLIAACLAAAMFLAGPGPQAQPGFPATDVSERPSTGKTAAIPYATVGDETLALDLYMPAGVDNPPLVVYVHGGAWRFGSRDSVSVIDLVDHGFALASVSFRLTPVSPLPAQVHDIKAAIRFLRANAGEYGYDATRIGITGVSSGAHLAALVGLTNGSAPHEGEIGGNTVVSSDVHAIVSYFGASNLTTILGQSTPFGLNVREPAIELLLGGSVEDKVDLARFGSPVFQVDPRDPALLLLHGDQDPQMPINQSHELHGTAKENGLTTHFEVIHGAGHGGEAFFDAERTELAAEFLAAALRP